MGQIHSTFIPFADKWSASTVANGRIICKESCRFTQYSAGTFYTNQEVTVHCKFWETNNGAVAFGILPKSEKAGCRNNLIGQQGIYGSIGCYITDSKVCLFKNGDCFFAGNYTPEAVPKITMKVNHGKISFLVDDKKLGSEELEGMAFHGEYKLGVSMQKAGQKAEVFFSCPVTFKDIWSAGNVSEEMLTVRGSTNFTFFSNELLETQGRYTVIANVMKNCNNSVGLGVVPKDCKDMCQSNLPGMLPGSIACLVKHGTIVVMINGDLALAADVDTADPCVLMMVIEDGQLTFFLDGREVDCETLKTTHMTEEFRIGVGCSYEGQVIEMRGNGSDTGKIIPDGNNESATGLEQQLISLLRGKIIEEVSGGSGVVRWRDNMKSIDCDSTDRVAVCVKKFTATIFSQCVVPADENHSVEIQVLENPSSSGMAGPLMMIGIMNDDTSGHATHHLGAPGLRNSLGITNRGDLINNGETIGSGLGFSAGDVVSMVFNNGSLSIKVNGTEAVSEIANLSFKNKFRWAVSFTAKGQAVKLGAEDLTPSEDKFCTQHGIVVSNVMTSVTTTVCSDSPSPDEETLPGTKQGGCKSTKLFEQGEEVFYCKNGPVSKATILRVHFDSTSEPYYTISVDGKEKQTEQDHLFKSYHEAELGPKPTSMTIHDQPSLQSTNTSASSQSTSIAGCFIDPSDLKYGGKSLGEGSFGKVFKGKWDDSDVAVKEVPWEDSDEQLREIAVGCSLAQPNIATIMGWSKKGGDKLLIVMPLFRNGSLADRLSQINPELTPSPATGGPFGFPFVFRISLGLLRAIKYMASRQPHAVVHRDIKPANILLDENDRPMLTDFGTARSLTRTMATPARVGTPYYMAAEQAKEEETSSATDVYAAALVIYETLCAPRTVHDVTKTSMLKLMNDIAMGKLPPFEDIPKEIASILKPAFSSNPERRPTAAQMVSRFEALRDSYSTL